MFLKTIQIYIRSFCNKWMNYYLLNCKVKNIIFWSFGKWSVTFLLYLDWIWTGDVLLNPKILRYKCQKSNLKNSFEQNQTFFQCAIRKMACEEDSELLNQRNNIMILIRGNFENTAADGKSKAYLDNLCLHNMATWLYS